VQGRRTGGRISFLSALEGSLSGILQLR